MRYFLVFWIFLVLAPSGFAARPAAGGPHIESFSPQGSVKAVRQVTVRFSDAMVRFGDPRLPEPFAIDCPAAGTGRWVDGRSWVFDFSEDLPAGVRCKFSLKPESRSSSGAGMVGAGEFVFDTGGPAVLDSLPGEGSRDIDEYQMFILRLDTPARPETILANAYCEIEGVSERIEVDLIRDEDRARLLSAPLRERYRYFFSSLQGSETDQGKLAVLRCRRNLPAETEVRLVWGRGIASLSGIASEQAQTLTFRTRPPFVARFQCDKVNANARCVPMLPMILDFSAPIPADQARAVRLLDERGKAYPANEIDVHKTPTVDEIAFQGPFPEKTRFTLELPAGLRDDGGRALENTAHFPLAVETDEYPPLAKFSGEFGIIESKEGGILPVTLRNLEAGVAAKRSLPGLPVPENVAGRMQRADQSDVAVIAWLKKVQQAAKLRYDSAETGDGGRQWKNLTGAESVFGPDDPTTALSVPKPAGAKAFEVVGIPLKEPGFYVVELASPRLGAALLGEPKPRYVATSALVTNLAVHFKWGRESSLVWVTTLDTAQPVADAEIQISDFCDGTPLWEGRAGPDGMIRIGGGLLPKPDGVRECTSWNDSHPLFISAHTGGDFSFSVSGWNAGILPDDFQLPIGSAYQSKVAHTVFDRTLFRAGETVSMKHYLRLRTSAGFLTPSEDLPDQLQIRHQGSGDKYELPVAFDGQGIAESSWSIPQEAKLGSYQASLVKAGSWWGDAGSFQVEQFRVPTMKAVIQPAAEFLVNAKQARVDLFVNYLSGGGASFAPVKLRTQVQPRAVHFDAYPDYSFGGKDVKAGIAGEVVDQEAGSGGNRPVQVLPLTLDKAGAARSTIPDLPPVQSPQDLVTELEYLDSNGERLSVSRRIPLWPAKLNLGVRTEARNAGTDPLRFQVLTLDLAGKPVESQRIGVELFQKTTYSYRKRLIGGFYTYEDKTEFKRLGGTCEANTNRAGIIACEVRPGVSGEIILRAATQDDLGNTAIATRDVWVAGSEDWWFENAPSDRMDVLPEKKSYEHDEVARFQVRMPFREATALVTVEREGVLDAFVARLSGKAPVISVPIKPGYAPNVYVSVLAVRGRPQAAFTWLKDLVSRFGFVAADRSVTALVDLNKPAYRLGLKQIDVGWAPYQLDVRVRPERDVYQVREEAKLKVSVSRADRGPLPTDAEIALAGVDEGLLELKPNDSWNLLEHMMGRRGIEVYTSTAQMQVVGKRHYGRKAIPHGGGGGRQTARELFDTFLLWRGRLPLNDRGEAEVTVPLNDSLTAFRLVAVASAGARYFGTGQTSIRTSQDVMLHSGLPALVREGDQFKAIFTLRNATSRRLPLQVHARVTADPPDKPVPELPPRQVELAPGEARELAWDVTVPIETRQLGWEVVAEEPGETTRDRLKLSQQVIPTYPVRTYQETLAQLGKTLGMTVERPQESIPGRGGLRVSLRSKLGDGLAGVADYMARYPYTCMEQRISRAISLRDRVLWESTMKDLPNFMDEDGLVKYFRADGLRGSDSLTAYLLAVAHEAGWAIPSDRVQRLTEGLKGFVAGRVVRHSVLPTADLAIRKLAAIEALSRYNQATASMLDSISIDPNLWPTSAVLDWLNILQRVDAIPERAARRRAAQQIIRARLNFQGTTLGFSTERDDALWWLMVSADVNAARTILSLLDQKQWREDMPRLAMGVLARRHHGHWPTTTANAWGTLAMEKFSAVFESTPVGGHTEASLAGVKQSMNWGATSPPSALDFSWPEGPASLEITHEGVGKPWATVQSRAALPLKAPVFAGYAIQRTLTPIEQAQGGRWNRGDVARVKLELDAQSDMTWVVVDDPVPAGASILGTGLGRDSRILTAGKNPEGWVWPVFEERRFDAFRAYYEYVPKGKWSIEYTVRFNNAGRFELPATRVEAMYAPEMFGELPNPPMEIGDE